MCTSDWVKPKVSILKGIFGQWIKDVFFRIHYIVNPQKLEHTAIFSITVQTCALTHAHPGKGTLNGTILSGRCFLQL